MINKMAIGEKIFTLRKKSGITQFHLSKLLNVNPQEISKWENGMTLPNTDLLPVLAELFDANFNEILCIEKANIIKQKRRRVLLPGIKYYNCDFSLISCIKSSLSFLGIHVSTGWISAPYAFMLKINNDGSFNNPKYRDIGECYETLIKNCGGIISKIHFHNLKTNDSKIYRNIQEKIQYFIDNGFPCYACKVNKPIYKLIIGYDEIGCYYIDPNSLKILGPKPYTELEKEKPSNLEAYTITRGKISNCTKTTKDVFEYAINKNTSLDITSNSKSTTGLNAYKILETALSKGNIDYYNVACNVSFWAKCKELAVLFLRESKFRIGKFQDSFDSAISYYEKTAKSLHQLSQLFPLNSNYNLNISDNHKNVATLLLKSAKRNEERGLTKIYSILSEIYKIW